MRRRVGVRLAATAAFALTALGPQVHAQQPGFSLPARPAPFPSYSPHRFNENDAALRGTALRSDRWDALNYIPLGQDRFLSLGGEQRARYESYREPTLGLGDGPVRNDYLLSRTLLHADVRLGPVLRVFGQLGAYGVIGPTAPVGPTQKNDVDLAQGFADLTAPLGQSGGSVTLRGGRQEMSFGSSRLVSTRDGPNVRLAFDGVRAFWCAADASGAARLDAFATRPVTPREGAFDDAGVDGQAFWGVYGTAPAGAALPGFRFDLYYLGVERQASLSAEDIANERRATVGLRAFGTRHGWDWDVEGAYQFGTFGAARIEAWTVATDAGFTVADAPWLPRIGVRADVASGDHRPGDGVLGTFNPLFPKLPYFTEAAFVVPANLMDLQPNLTVTPVAGLALSVAWNLLWRHRSEDAFYAPPLQPVTGTARGSNYVGSQAQLRASWQTTRHLLLTAAYVHFAAGGTIRRAGGRDADFVLLSAAYQF